MTATIENSPLTKWIFKAIDENYLIFIAITSQVQGKIKSDSLPFGPGKSTLELWLAYAIYKRILETHYKEIIDTYEQTNKVWDIVFENLFMQPKEIDQYVFRGPKTHPPPILVNDRIPLVLWDDVQETVGKDNMFDPYLKRLAFRFTKGRDWFNVLIGSMPMVEDLFVWYRRLFHMEIIIPTRGRFEFQRTVFARKFERWDDATPRAWYESESKAMFGYPPLPPEIQARYNKWVKEQHAKLDKKRWKQSEEEEEKPLEPPPTPSEASQAGRALIQARWRKTTPHV